MDSFDPTYLQIALGLLSAAGMVLLLIYLPRSEREFHIRTLDFLFAVFILLAPVFVIIGLILLLFLYGMRPSEIEIKSVVNRFAIVGSVLYIPAIVATYFFIRAKSPKPKPTLGLHRTNPLFCIGLPLLVTATFWYPFLLIGGAWESFLKGQGVKIKVQDAIQILKNEPNQALKIASMVAACTLIPFAEEFIFRGIVYPVLRRWAGAAAAVALSALIFAGIHLEPQVIPMIIPVGVVLAVLYERTRSLYYPIAFHAFFNASMLLMGWLTNEI